MDELRAVGRTYPIHDAAEKVTGDLVFGTDLRLPGMACAKLLLSPFAHAVVKGVDASAAGALPGVLGIFSHLNAPHTPYCRSRLVPGEPLCVEDETLFAKTARFVGDRVAAVVAVDGETAAEALHLIRVDYEPLPPVLTTEAALAADAVPIHDGGNLVYAYDRDLGAAPLETEDALSTVTTVTTQKLHHAALEPHVCLADYDRSGTLTIWTPYTGRLRRPHRRRRPPRPRLQPGPRDQSPGGRLVRWKAGVHPRARDGLSRTPHRPSDQARPRSRGLYRRHDHAAGDALDHAHPWSIATACCWTSRSTRCWTQVATRAARPNTA